jgi:predicted amidophosphoribosyltransferase
MITCPHCKNDNPPASNFCQQCGKPLSDATIAIQNIRQTILAPREKKLELSQLFSGKADEADDLPLEIHEESAE